MEFIILVTRGNFGSTQLLHLVNEVSTATIPAVAKFLRGQTFGLLGFFGTTTSLRHVARHIGKVHAIGINPCGTQVITQIFVIDKVFATVVVIKINHFGEVIHSSDKLINLGVKFLFGNEDFPTALISLVLTIGIVSIGINHTCVIVQLTAAGSTSFFAKSFFICVGTINAQTESAIIINSNNFTGYETIIHILAIGLGIVVHEIANLECSIRFGLLGFGCTTVFRNFCKQAVHDWQRVKLPITRRMFGFGNSVVFIHITTTQPLHTVIQRSREDNDNFIFGQHSIHTCDRGFPIHVAIVIRTCVCPSGTHRTLFPNYGLHGFLKQWGESLFILIFCPVFLCEFFNSVRRIRFGLLGFTYFLLNFVKVIKDFLAKIVHIGALELVGTHHTNTLVARVAIHDIKAYRVPAFIIVHINLRTHTFIVLGSDCDTIALVLAVVALFHIKLALVPSGFKRVPYFLQVFVKVTTFGLLLDSHKL